MLSEAATPAAEAALRKRFSFDEWEKRADQLYGFCAEAANSKQTGRQQ
jgi:hypothetical protein